MHPIEVEAGVMLASRYLLERLIEQVPSGVPNSPPPADPIPIESQTAPSVAQTWYAKDSVLSRPVIVHTLPAADPRAPRLLEAARQAATAGDVHFLRVLDADSDGDVAYTVREWVSGRTLSELLADGPLPAEPAGWIVREVAQAVTSLHGQGTAHLRLDPDNVILTDAGAVRIKGLITDAVLHGETPADEKTATKRDTRDLGRLLYAALTARWPDGAHASLRAAPRSTDGSPLSPRQCRAGVPRVLDEITDRILADRPRHGSPLVSPLEVTAALTDAVGDAPPDGIQPTAPVRNGKSNSQSSPDEEATALYRRPLAPPAATGVTTGAAATTSAAAFNGQPDPDATNGLPLAGGIGTGATVTYAERRPDTPRWRTAVIAIVAVIFLGGIALIGWQLAFQTTDKPGATTQPTEESDEPEEPPAEEEEPGSKEKPKGPYKIAGADDFDPPPGNGEERPEEVGNVADGDPGTMWTTVEYYNYPELGRLKDGVGVWVDLGAERKVGSVDVTLRPGGTNLELRAAPGATAPPSDIDSWETVGSAEGADAEFTFTPEEPVATRFLLLWLTELPPSEGGFRGGISEVVVNR